VTVSAAHRECLGEVTFADLSTFDPSEIIRPLATIPAEGHSTTRKTTRHTNAVFISHSFSACSRSRSLPSI
jgi:hypothetical protein